MTRWCKSICLTMMLIHAWYIPTKIRKFVLKFQVLIIIDSFSWYVFFIFYHVLSMIKTKNCSKITVLYWFALDLSISTPWHFPFASICLFALMQMTIGLRQSNLKVIHKRSQISASSNDFPRHEVAKTSVARFDISFQAKSMSWVSVNLKWQLFWSKFLQWLFLHIV